MQADTTRAVLCFASALALAIFLIVSGAIIGSRFGTALIAVRDAESRMRFLGYRVETYKLFVFVLSAAMAGIAGALYVPQVGIINPSEFAPGNSIEAVIWVAVGGRGTLIGAGDRRLHRQLRQDLADRRAARMSGCSRWARCSSSSPCSCPRASSGSTPSCVLADLAKKATARHEGDRSPSRRRRPDHGPSHYLGILYLSGVTVSFDGFKALNNLSLLIEPGEMRAIIGPNGAGKTTMMDVITGKTRPDEGEVVFDGQRRPHQARRGDTSPISGIGRKFQKPTVFESQTVRDNILLALAGLRGLVSSCCRRGADQGRERPHRAEILSIIRLEAQQHMLGGAPQPWPEAMAGDRHAAGAGPQADAGRRAGGRHDRRRDRDHRAGAARGRTSRIPSSWSSTT